MLYVLELEGSNFFFFDPDAREEPEVSRISAVYTGATLVHLWAKK